MNAGNMSVAPASAEPSLQRSCGCGGACESCSRKRLQQTWTRQMTEWERRAQEYSVRMTDCLGTLPTDADLQGTGFTASICTQNH